MIIRKEVLCTIAEQLRIEEVRDNVYEALSVRFRQVSNEIKGMLNNIADRNVLKSLHRKAIVCHDLPEFYSSLNLVTAKKD